MQPPISADEFLELVEKSGVVHADVWQAHVAKLRADTTPTTDAKVLANSLVEQGLITFFQAQQLLQGRWRGFSVGKYLILERIGSGGMGVVYLADHKLLHRKVAIKVLPTSMAEDGWFLELFYKEAQAAASLRHPNIVHAYDIDHDGKLHFIVMEYVEGSSLHEIVRKHGLMDPIRVAHYIKQAALGLQHAHQAGLVHRDIKPGNLLLDRQGVVKILDLGLACLNRHDPRKTATFQASAKVIVGTDDYLAPEQIVDSDDVDIRADIYSLGVTAYFLLTGNAPFHDAAMDHHKLIWHLTRRPKPIRTLRPEVPEGLAAVFDKMMAKNPWERYQLPEQVAEALAPWTKTPIPPPAEKEMPDLSLAARRSRLGEATPSSISRRPAGKSSWVICGEGSTSNSSSSSPPPSVQNSISNGTPINKTPQDTAPHLVPQTQD